VACQGDTEHFATTLHLESGVDGHGRLRNIFHISRRCSMMELLLYENEQDVTEGCNLETRSRRHRSCRKASKETTAHAANRAGPSTQANTTHNLSTAEAELAAREHEQATRGCGTAACDSGPWKYINDRLVSRTQALPVMHGGADKCGSELCNFEMPWHAWGARKSAFDAISVSRINPCPESICCLDNAMSLAMGNYSVPHGQEASTVQCF
jgi:hypothetical protein